eukprot:4315732-Lingulodinium_polyedra.AAC.1
MATNLGPWWATPGLQTTGRRRGPKMDGLGVNAASPSATAANHLTPAPATVANPVRLACCGRTVAAERAAKPT